MRAKAHRRWRTKSTCVQLGFFVFVQDCKSIVPAHMLSAVATEQEDGVLSDSAVAISAVDADVHSAGKDRAALPASAVATEQEDGVLPDSAVAISTVDAGVHSAGKEQAALPFSEVVTRDAGGGTAALHVARSSPSSSARQRTCDAGATIVRSFSKSTVCLPTLRRPPPWSLALGTRGSSCTPSRSTTASTSLLPQHVPACHARPSSGDELRG